MKHNFTEEELTKAWDAYALCQEPTMAACMRAAIKALPDPPPSPAALIPITEPLPPVPSGYIRLFTQGMQYYTVEREMHDEFYIDVRLPEDPFLTQIEPNPIFSIVWKTISDDAKAKARAAWEQQQKENN